MLRHALFDESREGRAAEIAAWSNGASALAVAAGVTVIGWASLPIHSAWIGVITGALTLAALRFSLAHRYTVWIAATVGTLTIAGLGGGLAWLFAHLLEITSAPSIAAVLGALLAALAPAWAYAHLARRRANDVPDSLVTPPVSRAPRSRRSSFP